MNGLYIALEDACLVVFAGEAGTEGYAIYGSLAGAVRALDPFQGAS